MNIIALILILSTSSYASISKPTIVYGNDNRVEVESLSDSRLHELARSIAVRVDKNSLDDYSSYFSVKYAAILDDVFGAPMCAGQRFSSQPSIADCTGFLVDEDTLITAGHCMLDSDGEQINAQTPGCRNNYWVFDYMYNDSRLDLENISHDNVYSCKSVEKAVLNEITDYSIVKLDRKVVGRTGLKFRKSGSISTNADIFVIGAPSGLPLKYAGEAKVTGNRDSQYFSTNLDTFGGNSGSPVFNKDTLEVEGILVRGRTDYVQYNSAKGVCIAVNKCDQNGKNCLQNGDGFDLEGEHVFRINSLSL